MTGFPWVAEAGRCEGPIASFVGTPSMTGRNGVTMPALSVEQVQALLRRHGRLIEVEFAAEEGKEEKING